jgi:predicted transcriptional regulator YdeE
MKKAILNMQEIKLQEIKLIGLSVRTNNKNEMNPKTSKIGELAGRYWGQNIAAQITDRKNPDVTLSVYTEYDSDEHGDYTYFVGEEVSSFENMPSGFQQLIIPSAKYQKFTTSAGKMPKVVINAWQQIWKMSSDDFEGKRAYQTDFEIYDQRASDPSNTIVDTYVGIK